MKIAHLAVVTPHRSGLYETTRDLVIGERSIGLDACIVDPMNPRKAEDRGVPIADDIWDADVWVNHSGLPHDAETSDLAAKRPPIIHVMHGRPESSFLLEMRGKPKVYSYLIVHGRNGLFSRYVTFWQEFLPHWSLVVPAQKLSYVPAPVDLKHWTPDGPSGYGFHGHGGDINVVCADMWREDVTPYPVLNAFGIFAQRHRTAKLHLYGLPMGVNGWKPLVGVLQRNGNIGELKPMVDGLQNVYRAATMLITPHRIATRTVRESLACGCQVVMGGYRDYTPYAPDAADPIAFADAMDRALAEVKVDPGACRARNRASAMKHFDPAASAMAFKKLFDEVLA